ncbi:UNVERIFIED_CONTAM: hypothetical protein Sradi_0752600 [Sesamum radiatum]|uniref:SWIM-type domain-containing protein n=1 Tax=Sesamum radiatum TaxID=300843 RepID=A0AAW2VSF9_SESRA
MSTSSSRIDILVYFGGELSEDGWSVTYDRPIAVMRIPRSSTYAQFLARIYQKIGADSNEYLLKVSAKYSCTYLGHIKETVVEIKDDDTLSFFLDPAAEIPSMEVYVETTQIHTEVNPQMSQQWGEAVPQMSQQWGDANPQMSQHSDDVNQQMSQQWGDDNPQMSQQWGEYMSLLANPGFHSTSNTDFLGGTSNPNFCAGTSNPNLCTGTSHYDADFYTPDMVAVSRGLENIEINYTEPTHPHTHDDENFMPHEDENTDHIADTFANRSDEGSEPDEVEFPIPLENGPNDVDINVIAEEFARGMSSSSEQIMSNRTTQQTYYRSIPFFDQTFPEIPADSVDVPTLKYAKFYNTNEGRLDVGMLFKNKEALIEAVKDHSARHARREYYVTESSKTKWKVLCKHSTPGQVKCNPTFAIKHVIQTVKDHTGYDIPYQKAWYSLKMAREIVYGTWESSVQKLPKYMGAVQKYNPGTIVQWKHKALHPTGAYVIGYVFWAFKPCIEGFKFCRNIISVDGTHLYTRYKHKMLIAATMDGNQQVLPLAFAIVDDESYASWKWFLQQLSRHVIRGRRGVCLISDRHAGIIKAVNESSEFVPPNGVHRYCLRHVCSNFNSHHKNIVLKDLCWRAGSEYQIRKFNRIMEEIKGQKLEAFTFLDRINKEKWTASHDGGWRCGILTTNMSECINGVLKGARRLPVTAIVEITLQRTAHYFRERALRSAVMLSNGQLWTDFAKKKFTDWGEKSITHTVTKYDHLQQSASVVTKRQQGLGFNTHVVKLANRECSCGKWNQFGIPCSHAQKVCAAYNINAASMVKDYYDVRAYKNTYSKALQPVQSEEYWDVPNFELVHDTTIRTSTRPGRSQTSRIQNEMDWRQTRARQQAQRRGESSRQSNVIEQDYPQ